MTNRRALAPLALILALVLATGCASLPPGVGLETGRPVPDRIDQRLWLETLEIEDERATRQTAEALTLQVSRYIDESRYFRDIRLAPGKVKPEDLVLSIDLERYYSRRSVHPAYFPGALLTLTLWIWVGGPIFTDMAEFSGSAEIRNADGAVMARGSAEFSDRHNVSLWSTDYALPSATPERTRFFRELIDDVVAELEKGTP